MHLKILEERGQCYETFLWSSDSTRGVIDGVVPQLFRNFALDQSEVEFLPKTVKVR